MSDAQTPGRKQPEAFVEEFRSLVSSNAASATWCVKPRGRAPHGGSNR